MILRSKSHQNRDTNLILISRRKSEYCHRICINKWIKWHKTVTNQFLNIAQSDREGGRTVGSGRVATIIE